MKRIIVVGAGGHGRAVAEAIILAREYQLIGFLDDATQAHVWDVAVLGPAAELKSYRLHADAIVVAIGNNAIRRALHCEARAAGFNLASVIHPSAIVSPRATIGQGSTVMAGAIVGTEACLGVGVVVNAGATVDHHCRVEDFGHLGVGSSMAGGSILGAGAWMQAGSALGYGVRVDADAVLLPAEGKVV